MDKTDIVIIGAGAAGYFAAANAGGLGKVFLLEGTPRVLTKVKISGGGRCNVTHNIMDPRLFAENYPRGKKELKGPLTRFGAKDVMSWFSARGVELKCEADGRVFPTTDKSQTIIDCLQKAANENGVVLKTGFIVKRVEKVGDSFHIYSQKGEEIIAKKVLLTTGSAPIGYEILKSFNHSIVSLVPSLFTFTIAHPLLADLPGISFKKVSVQVFKRRETGSLLITHWGLSGPAVLKLSAFCARELFQCNYQNKVQINWLCEYQRSECDEIFKAKIKSQGSELVHQQALFELPKRFWQRVLTLCDVKPDLKYAELSKKNKEQILNLLLQSEMQITAKGEFKEEFVTAGGLSLNEVDFKTMESKLCSGLHVAGEILDIDGITGGFNFQNAWTGAYTAITALSASIGVNKAL